MKKEYKEIMICDFHELYNPKRAKELNKHQGVLITYEDGNWFKFCNYCVEKYGISYMVEEMWKRASNNE